MADRFVGNESFGLMDGWGTWSWSLSVGFVGLSWLFAWNCRLKISLWMVRSRWHSLIVAVNWFCRCTRMSCRCFFVSWHVITGLVFSRRHGEKSSCWECSTVNMDGAHETITKAVKKKSDSILRLANTMKLPSCCCFSWRLPNRKWSLYVSRTRIAMNYLIFFFFFSL